MFLVMDTPLSAPHERSNSSVVPNDRSDLEAPPSPSPVRRRDDLNGLTIPLRSVTISASPTEASTVTAAPPSPSAVPPELYQITTGPYQGCTIQQLPKVYRKQIGNDEDLLSSTPELRDALTAWASHWTFMYGRHEGKNLGDVPLYYLNVFVLRNGEHQKFGQEDLYVALKFHFPIRETEMPGEHYSLTFGQHSGSTLDTVPSYVTWLKSKGIPTQEGYEDLADALVFLHRGTLSDFTLANPQASTYTLPLEFGYGAIYLAELSEPELRDLCPDRDFGVHTERTLDGDYVYPGMRDAVEYWWLVFDCSRWNWRRERDADTGEVFGVSADLESKGLLYPRSNLREKAYVGYSRT